MPTNSALIADRLELLSTKVDGLAGRIRLGRPVRIAIAAAVALSLAGSYGAWRASNKSTTAVHEIVDARTEARHTQCRRDNEIRSDAITAARKKATDLIDTSDREKAKAHEPLTSPALRAEFIKSQGDVTAAAYPHRDCTEAGIDAYYKNPPPPDTTPCHPDGKGLCE